MAFVCKHAAVLVVREMKRVLEELVGKVGMGKAFLQIPEALTCMYTVLAAFHTFWNLNLLIKYIRCLFIMVR